LTARAAQGVLEGVFRELVARHVPLGTRDYLDGLRALNAGFGHGGRDDLRALCHRLWARSDLERRAIDLVFTLVPPPDLTGADIAELDQYIGTAVGYAAASRPSSDREPAALSVSDTLARAGARFSGAAEGHGIPIADDPSVRADGENYVLSPQTLFSERQLVVAWRRLRVLTRQGNTRELDIHATIDEKCRTGVLRGVTLRPSRQNISNLLILADVSPSMAPWRPFLGTVQNSLSLGNLCAWQMYFFSNYPRDRLFDSPALEARVRLDDIIEGNRQGAPLLILGDAGAARGGYNPRRVARTAEFVARVSGKFKPVVWLNPMPRLRWHGTSAEALTELPALSVFPLDRDSLIRAIDVLRGERPA
jgi:uncharacterized protein with von Willebrand factor type A (vWA) domain